MKTNGTKAWNLGTPLQKRLIEKGLKYHWNRIEKNNSIMFI